MMVYMYGWVLPPYQEAERMESMHGYLEEEVEKMVEYMSILVCVLPPQEGKKELMVDGLLYPQDNQTMRELDETTPLVGLYQSIYLLLYQKVGGWLGTG